MDNKPLEIMLQELGIELNADDSYFDILEKGKFALIMDDAIDDTLLAKEDILGFILDDSIEENDEIINPWDEDQKLIITHVDRENELCYVMLYE